LVALVVVGGDTDSLERQKRSKYRRGPQERLEAIYIVGGK